jgi:hypothetical protein
MLIATLQSNSRREQHDWCNTGQCRHERLSCRGRQMFGNLKAYREIEPLHDLKRLTKVHAPKTAPINQQQFQALEAIEAYHV